MKIDEPFQVTWKIMVKGRTQGDGEVYTVTSQIIRDKLQYLLDKLLREDKIEEYGITVATNDNKELTV